MGNKRIITQAPPATGKSWALHALKNKFPDLTILDTDDMWPEGDNGKTGFEAVCEKVRSVDFDLLVTNLWLTQIGLTPDFVVVPDYDTWLETLLDSRQDLVDTFGFKELKSWYNHYTTLEFPDATEIIKLKPGEYLSSALPAICVKIKHAE